MPGKSKTLKTASNSSRLILASLALAGCGRHPAPSSDAYADSAACATCHRQIADTYGRTGMGRSFYRPGNQTFTSDYTLYHKASGRYYEVFSRNGTFYQGRHLTGYGNRETGRIEKQIDFVIGSGDHARTYLHRNAEGRLIELPVSWYSEKGGYWAMSPGYDNARPEDFRRPVPDECLFCHNGYPGGPDAVAEGIDCQRCHGPGQAHVASSGRAMIVNPAKLGRDRQLDVCMQCHLETTSLPLPNAIRRYGRAPFSYRPGEALTDYELFFDHAPGTGFDDRFEVAHQAYRLRKSACFLRSQMTCTTCHDPHQALRGEQAMQHYEAVCRSCHAAAHASKPPASGSTCLDCHMWKRRTDDAVHVVMTDHFIQRRKPARDLLAALEEKPVEYRGEVAPYYPMRSESELYAAVAQVHHESNLQAGIQQLERAIAKNKPDSPEYYFELGRAWSKSGNNGQAIRWYNEALRHRGDFHPALRELAASLALTGDNARAVEAGERAIAQQPPDTVALTNLGNAYLHQGNSDKAKQILEQALALNPDLPDANNLLGLVFMARQNPAAAEASFRSSIAIQPESAEPHSNLGTLLAGRGDLGQAAYHFQKAIAGNPSYGEAHRSYGLLLALMRSFGPAEAQLREAIRLSPNSAPLHLDLADVLMERGRAGDAEAECRRAVDIDPALAEAYYGLGNALAAERRTADAIRQFQTAIGRNPEYYEAHLALGTSMARTGNMTEARAHLRKAAESSDPAVRQSALKALR